MKSKIPLPVKNLQSNKTAKSSSTAKDPHTKQTKDVGINTDISLDPKKKVTFSHSSTHNTSKPTITVSPLQQPIRRSSIAAIPDHQIPSTSGHIHLQVPPPTEGRPRSHSALSTTSNTSSIITGIQNIIENPAIVSKSGSWSGRRPSLHESYNNFHVVQREAHFVYNHLQIHGPYPTIQVPGLAILLSWDMHEPQFKVYIEALAKEHDLGIANNGSINVNNITPNIKRALEENRRRVFGYIVKLNSSSPEYYHSTD